MLILWALALCTSPFNFEIDRGPILEIKGGGSFPKRSEERSSDVGARLSYSFANIRDFYFSAELEGTFQRPFDKNYRDLDAQSNDPNKYLVGGNLVIYELFNPTAVRLAGGGGWEKRFDKNNYYFSYRTGFGYYVTADWALFGDIGSRTFKRNGRYDYPVEVAISFQYIF